MSYILEALKRAERERRAGTTSSLLDEIHSANAPARPPAWQRWILPAVIAALVAALLIYLIVGRGKHAAAPATVAAAVDTAATPASIALSSAMAPPASAPMPGSGSVAADSASGHGPATETAAPAIEDDGEISSLKDLDEQPAADEADTQDTDESEGETPPAPAPPHPNAAHTAQRPTIAQSANTADADADAAAAASTPATPTPAPSSTGDDSAADALATAQAPSQAAPASAATQNLREMPDAFRASFPAISVDVHAYSEVPAQRFVLIGGKRYRENDALPQGPRIVSIVPEGIVFDWQGQRVLYAMNR